MTQDQKDKIASSIQEARDELETALAELEHLPIFDSGAIAFAAHALHNYLTVISGTLQMLSRSLLSHPDPDVQRWLEGLLKTTDVMDHTVNQLMGTAADSGPKLARDRVDLAHLVRRASYFYDRIAARKKIRITAMPEGPMPDVLGDRLAIAAALDNLVSNAVKFSPPGTTVTLDVLEEPGRLICSVTDRGPGISPEDQKKLFLRGTILSAKPTGGEPSTGYGLAVAKDLIEKQGGRIWCESKLGQGATFSFELPTAPAGSPAGETRRA